MLFVQTKRKMFHLSLKPFFLNVLNYSCRWNLKYTIFRKFFLYFYLFNLPVSTCTFTGQFNPIMSNVFCLCFVSKQCSYRCAALLFTFKIIFIIINTWIFDNLIMFVDVWILKRIVITIVVRYKVETTWNQTRVHKYTFRIYFHCYFFIIRRQDTHLLSKKELKIISWNIPSITKHTINSIEKSINNNNRNS